MVRPFFFLCEGREERILKSDSQISLVTNRQALIDEDEVKRVNAFMQSLTCRLHNPLSSSIIDLHDICHAS